MEQKVERDILNEDLLIHGIGFVFKELLLRYFRCSSSIIEISNKNASV